MNDTVELIENGRALAIPAIAARFHAVWLRDNALEADVRDPRNGQRLVTLADWPEDPNIGAARIEAGTLIVRFADETVERRWAIAWLAAHAYDHDSSREPGWTGAEITRWDAALGDDLPTADFAAICGHGAALRAMLAHVARLGFVRLTGVPAEPGVPVRIADLFGHVRTTNYGAVFDVRAEAQPENLAYTRLGLQAHTDNPYRDPTPGVQILASLVNEAQGGETLLIDGFAVAARIAREAPADFALLTRYPARFAYAGGRDVRLAAKFPLIELGADGELRAVRFNNRSAAPLVDLPFADMPGYYRAMRRLAATIEDPALAVRFRLDASTAIVFDNLRILHARTAITGAGLRHLQGCYVDRDGLHSKLAVLADCID